MYKRQVEDYLKEAGMEVALFEGVEPDPSVETVMKGAKLMQEFGPDWICLLYTSRDGDFEKLLFIRKTVDDER